MTTAYYESQEDLDDAFEDGMELRQEIEQLNS